MSQNQTKPKKTSLQRIEDTERDIQVLMSELAQVTQNIQAIAEYINSMHSEVRSSIGVLDDCFGALVDVMGDGTREKVTERLTEVQVSRLEDRAAEEQQRIADMVEGGIIEPADSVSEESLIIGHELNPEGETLPPGWLSSGFSGLIPEVQDAVLRNGTGTEVTLPNGNVFVVDEIYNFTQSAEAEVNSENE